MEITTLVKKCYGIDMKIRYNIMTLQEAVKSIEDKNILRPLTWLESMIADKIWYFARHDLVSEMLSTYGNEPHTFDSLLSEHQAIARILRKNIDSNEQE